MIADWTQYLLRTWKTEQFDILWKICTVSISLKLWYVCRFGPPSTYKKKDEWYNHSLVLCFRLPFSIQYVLFNIWLKFSVIYYFTERLYIHKMSFYYTANKIFREFDLYAVCRRNKPQCYACGIKIKIEIKSPFRFPFRTYRIT